MITTTFWKGDVLYEIVDGLLRREVPRRNGVARFWHANGILEKEMCMVNGVADGVVREWHANGNVLRETPYKNGAVDGVVSQWNSEGKLLGQYTLSAGLGVQRKWNEDGTLSLEVEIVNEGCHRGTVWDDKGRARKVYLWNGRPVSKGRFEAKIAEKSIKP